MMQLIHFPQAYRTCIHVQLLSGVQIKGKNG